MRIRGYPAGVPCWTQLRTPDPAGSARFYGSLFGWAAGDEGTFRLADRAVAGYAQADDQPAGWLSYVAADDADAAVANVVAAGGTVLAPAAPVQPGGRAAVVRDTTGAVFGLWQRVAFGGAQVAGEPRSVCWTDLATFDLANAEAFYAKVFGWAAAPRDYTGTGAPYLEFSAAHRAVAGLRPLPPEAAGAVPPHWLVTFDVDGHADAVARCVAGGARIALGPLDAGVGTYAHVIDPYGAAFGLIELDARFRLP